MFFINVEIIIYNGNKYHIPVIEDGITLESERKGSPSKLTFTVIADSILNITEGNAVKMSVDGNSLFYGFIFSQKRDKSQKITITAYDQIRYLKNKDTYIYTNKTASDLIKMIANDYNLNIGTIENTAYRIVSRVEDNTTLMDMIQNALALELSNKKTMYVLYDACGKLFLKSLSAMRTNILIDEETGENYDYTSSIDEQTYNKIKLIYENKDTCKRDVYIAKDSAHINDWGILQYYDTLKSGENGQAKADALLSLYNTKTRNLKITKAFGNLNIRAGNLVFIKINLGDIKLQNYMLVEKCKHTFNENNHTMDLTLRGGEFIV